MLSGRFPSSLKPWRLVSGRVERRQLTTFRLVPGRNTSNKGSYRVLHAIHDLGDLKQSLWARISFRPFRILEREHIWWDMIITPDHARFYITLPAGEWSEWAKAKIERRWDGIVISEATDEDMELLHISENAEVCRLNLKRHNMFSLAVDRREETHPIGDLLGIIDDLKENEKVRLAVKMDPVDRLRWQKAAESAHKRFRDGKMPKRGGSKLGDIIKDALHLIMWFISELFFTLPRLFPGGSNTENVINFNRDDRQRTEVLVNGRLSRSTFEKANLPVFSCECYLMAHANNDVRAEALVASATGALASEMDENNEWVKIHYRSSEKKKIIKRVNERRFRFMRIDKTVLSTKELGKVAQLPSAGVQDQYRKQVMASEKLSIDLPAAITGEGIPYGVSESRGKKVAVNFPVKVPDETVKVSVFIGESGSGKSTAVINRALGALEKGKSVFMYDFTNRRPLDQLLNAVPADFPEDHIVCLNYGNRAWPIGTAWNEVAYGIKGGWEDVLASEFWVFFSRYADDGVARTRRWMKKAALACAEAQCLNPLNVTLMLLSKKFRAKVLQKVEDPILKATWAQWEKASEANQITMAEPILSRIDYLLDNRALKHSICQQPKLGADGKPLLDFRKWADGDERGPYLVLIHVPKTVFSASGLDAMMAWLNAKEWLMTLTRDDKYPECLIIKDEVHQIPSLAAKAEEQIVESRKYRVGPVWVFHSLAQVEKISPSMIKILKANNPHIHLLKSDEDTYKLLRTQLLPFTVEDDLLPMERHWAVNRWHVDGKPQVFMCKLNRPPKKVKDRSYLWELHSRVYGRPLEEVVKEISENEMALFEVEEKKGQKKKA